MSTPSSNYYHFQTTLIYSPWGLLLPFSSSMVPLPVSLSSSQRYSIRLLFGSRPLLHTTLSLFPPNSWKMISLYRPYARLVSCFRRKSRFRVTLSSPSSSVAATECSVRIINEGAKFSIFLLDNSAVLLPDHSYIMRLYANDTCIMTRLTRITEISLPQPFFQVNFPSLYKYRQHPLSVEIAIGEHLQPEPHVANLESSPCFFLTKLTFIPRFNLYRCYIPKHVVHFVGDILNSSRFWIAFYDKGKRIAIISYKIKKTTTKQIFVYFRPSNDLQQLIAHSASHQMIQAGIDKRPSSLVPFPFPGRYPVINLATICHYHLKGKNSLWIGVTADLLLVFTHYFRHQSCTLLFRPSDYHPHSHFTWCFPQGMQFSGVLKIRHDRGGWLYAQLPPEHVSVGIPAQGLAQITLSYDPRIRENLRLFYKAGEWCGLLHSAIFSQLNVALNTVVMVEFKHNEIDYQTPATVTDYLGQPAIILYEEMPWFRRTFFKEQVIIYPLV